MRLMQKLPNIAFALGAALLLGSPAFAQYQPQPQYANQSLPGQPPSMPTQPYTGPVPQTAAMPPQQFMQPQAAMQAPAQGLTIGQWFTYYDQIRRDAQMNPNERQQADQLLSKGLSILVPGDTKLATKALLGSLVGRYQRACAQLRQLPQIPPTQQLHTTYFNYFNTAGNLFNDYLRVQDNLLASDASTGQPLAAGLIQRKQMLEALEGHCKQMDTAARAQFGIPPYQY